MKWVRDPGRGFLSLALLLAGCRTPTPAQHLERMYVELHKEMTAKPPRDPEDPDWLARQKERLATVRDMVEHKQIVSAADHLRASVLLLETHALSDLELARELALKAA